MRNEPATSLLADESAAPARVLIASAQGDMRALLAHLMTAAGFEVSKVRDGNEALERIGDQLLVSPPRTFDLVILDIRQRQPNGLDLFMRLAHGAWRPPVILIAPADQAELRHKTVAAGAFAVLEWPFAVEQLHATAAAACDSRRRALAR